MKLKLLLVALFAAGCAPEIGDACSVSTDCSQAGEVQCDVAQQGGYCTVFDCEAGTCPEEATCVVFGASPSNADACTNETGTTPSQRSACMLTCEESSDCRREDGYACLTPAEVGAKAVDGKSGGRVCVFAPVAALTPADAEAGVCEAETPTDGAAGAGGAGSDG
jgi:hypothetical protein